MRVKVYGVSIVALLMFILFKFLFGPVFDDMNSYLLWFIYFWLVTTDE